MWKVLPKFSVIKVVGGILAVVATSAFVWATEGWLGFITFFTGRDIWDLFKILTPILMVFMGIIWFLGAVAWKALWKLPWLGAYLNHQVCPNLNGTWVGETESSYSDDAGNRKKTPVELKVRATLFGFDMSFKSIDEYQGSKIIQSEIHKDPRDGSFSVSYIFEAEVENPVETDDTKFDGAAKLKVKYDVDNDIELSGIYWTNRAWQRKMQTVGNIRLSRATG